MADKKLKERLLDFVDELETDGPILGFEVILDRPILEEEKQRQGFSDIKELVIYYVTKEKVEL